MWHSYRLTIRDGALLSIQNPQSRAPWGCTQRTAATEIALGRGRLLATFFDLDEAAGDGIVAQWAIVPLGASRTRRATHGYTGMTTQ